MHILHLYLEEMTAMTTTLQSILEPAAPGSVTVAQPMTAIALAQAEPTPAEEAEEGGVEAEEQLSSKQQTLDTLITYHLDKTMCV